MARSRSRLIFGALYWTILRHHWQWIVYMNPFWGRSKEFHWRSDRSLGLAKTPYLIIVDNNIIWLLVYWMFQSSFILHWPVWYVSGEISFKDRILLNHGVASVYCVTAGIFTNVTNVPWIFLGRLIIKRTKCDMTVKNLRERLFWNPIEERGASRVK